MNEQLQLLTTATNILWLILAGFLVFFMQAGFALVETGFTRAKNVAHTMLMNMMVFCIGAIGYWICGFAFEFGAINLAYPEVATAGAIAGPWAFSPITLGAWGDSLASGIRLGDQFGVLGTTGFFPQWDWPECHRYLRLLPVSDGLHGYRRDDPDRLGR
jgi:ammonium transporter, Amt family